MMKYGMMLCLVLALAPLASGQEMVEIGILGKQNGRGGFDLMVSEAKVLTALTNSCPDGFVYHSVRIKTDGDHASLQALGGAGDRSAALSLPLVTAEDDDGRRVVGLSPTLASDLVVCVGSNCNAGGCIPITSGNSKWPNDCSPCTNGGTCQKTIRPAKPTGILILEYAIEILKSLPGIGIVGK